MKTSIDIGKCPNCQHILTEHILVASPETDIQVFGEASGDQEHICLHNVIVDDPDIVGGAAFFGCDCVLVFRLPRVAV